MILSLKIHYKTLCLLNLLNQEIVFVEFGTSLEKKYFCRKIFYLVNMGDFELSGKQIQQIADKTAKLVVRHLKSSSEPAPVLVGVKEAARILGISVDHMRKIKDEYQYIRRGKSQQGHIFFIRESLTAVLPDEKNKCLT